MDAKSYEYWENLTDKERERIIKTWNPYQGDGAQIIYGVLKSFKEKYENKEGIKEIDSGIYHGGIYMIIATVKKGAQVRLPKSYKGIMVMKFYEQ